jgi:diguanylate cyclase (GGDEF)-like protein
MDLFANGNQLLKLFVEFLGVGQSHQTVEPERWRRVEADFGPSIYADLLYLLTRKEFTRDEARSHWYQLLDHQHTLARAVGREVGFQVALCDYFTNVHPLPGNLVVVELSFLLEKERTSLLDGLTGLYNRRYLDRVLDKEIELARRFGQTFAVLLIHVDQLREYHQLHGRDNAERVLSIVADLVLRQSRIFDQTFRYDEDDIVMLLPNTDRDKAFIAAGRHLNNVSGHPFPGLETISSGTLTVTIGLVVYPEEADKKTELLRHAALAVDRGRRQGGGQVVF